MICVLDSGYVVSPKTDELTEENEMFSGKNKTSSWGSYCNAFKTDSDVSDNSLFHTSDDASDKKDELKRLFLACFCFTVAYRT